MLYVIFAYTVAKKGAIWHLLRCQTLVQKTTPHEVPFGIQK